MAQVQLGGPLPPVRAPLGNQVTLSKTLLGKALFWDEQLSSTRTMSCGSCHIPSAGGSDPRSFGIRALHPGLDGVTGTGDDVLGSPGVPATDANGNYVGSLSFGLGPQVTGRRSMSLINAAFVNELFWDGRAADAFVDPESGLTLLNRNAALESQAVGPVLSDVEMGHMGITFSEFIERIEDSPPLDLAANIPLPLSTWINGRDYAELFEEAFGSAGVSAARFAMALATYERTLVADQTPLRDFADGDTSALLPDERRGLQVFQNRGCATCHGGPRLTNDAFFYTGVRPAAEDLGRFLVTGINGDRGAMKTPSLLNLSLRAPFFHQGGKASIAEVVDFYDQGGDFNAPNLDPRIRPLNLTAGQRSDLIAFLGRPLVDARVRDGLVPFDRPSLYSEGLNVPLHYGAGTPGSSGVVPQLLALEPAKVGNPNMSIGIESAPAGGLGVLLFGTASDLNGTDLLGAAIHVQLTPTLVTRMLPLTSTGVAAGSGSLSFRVPGNLALVGMSRFVQWLVLAPGESGIGASTDAVRVTAF
jgi:cytochrome c peroxidase